MSLTHEEIEQYLSMVFLDKRYSYIDDNLLVVFKFPSHSIKQKANLLYKRSFESAVNQGMLPNSELITLVEKRNIITELDKLTLKKLESQLEAQNVLLSKTTRVKANQERIKGAIRRLKHEIREIEFKRSSKLMLSAETKAEEDKTFYTCSQCVYLDDEKTLYWPSYEDALKENKITLKDKILLGFIRFYSGFSSTIIRELARSSLWRIRYINSVKTSDPLFGVPTSDYTTDQLNLVYWANYYQNIYEMMAEDRPSDIVIEDDDALDAYMKAFYGERNRQEAERKHKHKRSGKLSAFDAEEVIVTRSHELYEDIEYDQPREAQKLKERNDIRKRTAKGR
jgi:hypothetical protein